MDVLRTLFALLLLTASAHAADLAWDYDEYHALTDGFVVHFTDGVEQYNYTFLKDDAIVDGDTVSWGPIADRLQLKPGVEYTFQLERYNAETTSGVAGQAPVAYMVPGFAPPADKLPERIVIPPITITINIEVTHD